MGRVTPLRCLWCILENHRLVALQRRMTTAPGHGPGLSLPQMKFSSKRKAPDAGLDSPVSVLSAPSLELPHLFSSELQVDGNTNAECTQDDISTDFLECSTAMIKVTHSEPVRLNSSEWATSCRRRFRVGTSQKKFKFANV